MGGRGWNVVWSNCKLYMATTCSLSGGPGDILCLHRFPRDTICQKDCVSAGRAFKIWNLIITYFNSLGRASFWHRRRGYLLSKPAFLYLSRNITFMHWRRKWQPTPVFLPGESQGRGSLVGCRLWGHTESYTTEAT